MPSETMDFNSFSSSLHSSQDICSSTEVYIFLFHLKLNVFHFEFEHGVIFGSFGNFYKSNIAAVSSLHTFLFSPFVICSGKLDYGNQIKCKRVMVSITNLFDYYYYKKSFTFYVWVCLCFLCFMLKRILCDEVCGKPFPPFHPTTRAFRLIYFS